MSVHYTNRKKPWNPTRMRNKLASIAQRLKLPVICPLCNQYHKNNTAVCDPCYATIPRAGIACIICANPLSEGLQGLCGLCIRQKPWFDDAWIPCSFEEPLRSLIHQFKYHQGLYLTNSLASLMLSAAPQKVRPDYLIPVPMHPERLKSRGYNQAALLAQSLSKASGIPCALHLCKKTVNSIPQATLDSRQRKKNIHKTFTVQPVKVSHIVIVDDLMTTGSTVNELARLFKQHGVEKVSVWCCARAG